MTTDPQKAPPTNPLTTMKSEIDWLIEHPQFEERPATLAEFLGPGYLGIEEFVRDRIALELRAIFGANVNADRPTAFPLAMFTGAIGIGKTTIASIVLTYLAHWLLCLENPAKFYRLLSGTRIALMQMSTSEKQAREVVFGDIKARIENSPWFTSKYPYDPDFKNQIRFPQKDIWIIPGDSTETTFEGYNIFGGIIDEADSHKLTAVKDYAEEGYTTISSRVKSRFGGRGFLMVIGQMKSATGFAARKFEEFMNRADAYAVSLTIWESFGPDYYEKDEHGNVKVFYYDVRRKRVVPHGFVQIAGDEHRDNFIAVPNVYLDEFKGNPEKALRDLAGIPPKVGSTFISLVDKIDAARNRWIEHHDYWQGKSPVDEEGRVAQWFVADETLKRVAHLDIAYSGEGDAYGFAMGHVSEMVERNGEWKPYIVIDMLYRIKAPKGSEVYLGDMRTLIYALKNDRKFNLKKVTMDGFESTDTRQQLERQRFEVEEVSVDKKVLPYHDLREAIYEDRIEFPPYVVEILQTDGTHRRAEILVKELSELMDMGGKIDHPVGGSKDVSDAVAGVTFTLMGDRRFRQRVRDFSPADKAATAVRPMGPSHAAIRGDFSIPTAPLPPSTWSQDVRSR